MSFGRPNGIKVIIKAIMLLLCGILFCDRFEFRFNFSFFIVICEYGNSISFLNKLLSRETDNL